MIERGVGRGRDGAVRGREREGWGGEGGNRLRYN